jgi:hypothetical protein
MTHHRSWVITSAREHRVDEFGSRWDNWEPVRPASLVAGLDVARACFHEASILLWLEVGYVDVDAARRFRFFVDVSLAECCDA